MEIACPADCGYLISARLHPPAVVQRQHERDARFLLPILTGLTEPQSSLFMLLQGVVGRHRPSALPALQDRDVADAAAALTATYETAERGIIYEHRPAGLPAQRLVNDLKATLEALEARAPRSIGSDATEVLKRLQQAASSAAAAFGGGDTAYLDLMERFLAEITRGDAGAAEEITTPTQGSLAETPRLIVP